MMCCALGSEKFDVSPAADGANRAAGGEVRSMDARRRLRRAPEGAPMRNDRPGWVLGGEIARLVDRGYQKFLKTSKLEIPATADHLRAIHKFSEELKEAMGGLVLYNESLGTTSDRYVYDRMKGREA